MTPEKNTDPLIARNDLYVHITLLGLLIFLCLVPLASPYIQTLIPDLWQCPYQRITGTDCPFCGTMRHFRLMLQGYLHIPPKYIFLFSLGGFYVVWQSIAIWFCLKVRNKQTLWRFRIIYALLFILLFSVFITAFFSGESSWWSKYPPKAYIKKVELLNKTSPEVGKELQRPTEVGNGTKTE